MEHSPDGTQLVIVANAPGEAQAAALVDLEAVDPGSPGLATEVVWTSVRLGAAAAWNAGIRRAVAPVVVLVAPGTEPQADLLGAIVAALEDDTVAVAGPVGLVTDDLRRYEEAGDDATDVHAIAGAAIGFRRADYVARGPLDEYFVARRQPRRLVEPRAARPWLDDEDDEADEPADIVVDIADLPTPRRAVRVQSDDRSPRAAGDAPVNERLAKKNLYRLLKYYATRRDLLARLTRTIASCGEAITESLHPRYQGRGLADNIVPPAVWHSEASLPARRPLPAPPPILRPCVVGSASLPSSSGSPATATCGRPALASPSRSSASWIRPSRPRAPGGRLVANDLTRDDPLRDPFASSRRPPSTTGGWPLAGGIAVASSRSR